VEYKEENVQRCENAHVWSKYIKNGRTTVEINRHGAVTGISDSKSGYTYFASGKSAGSLFHILIPVPTWSSRAILPSLSKAPEIIDDAESCLLIYDNMQLNKKPTGIRAELRMVFPPGSDEILVTLRLSNNGRETVAGVVFPWIKGWRSPGNRAYDRIMLGPSYGKVNMDSLPGWTPAWGNGTYAQNSIGASYPQALIVPWIDFSGERGGVSCINYQEEPRNHYASIIKDMAPDTEGYPGFLWGFYAYVPPGSNWESPAMGISVHDGDWHRTADRYRKWMDCRIIPAKSSKKFRESIGSQHVFFNYFDGTPVRPYKTLPQIASTGRKYGVRELCVWDRLSLGTYVRFASGEDLLLYPEGDRKVLTRAIRQAVRAGSDVSALVNFRLMNKSIKAAEKYEDEMQTALDGSPKMEIYPVSLIPGNFSAAHLGPYCDCFSPFSEKYRHRVLKKIDEYMKIGYTSLFYDQPFECRPDYSHKHRGGVPEMTYRATLDLIRDVRQRLRKKNPRAIIMGEQCEIFATQIIDQWMCWVWSDRDIESAIRLHYSCPHTVINCVVDADCGLASHAFAAGLHLMLMTKGGFGYLADVPEFALHVRKLSDLRKRCAARTVHARFCESRGFQVESDDNIVAYSYESSEGPALILAAPEHSGRITVHIDRMFFSEPGSPGIGKIFRLDGSESEIKGDIQTFELDKHEVIVWFAG